ncbi:uncharacterized protein LOC131009745 [Salvia miltiorrhiza]|uniref:uncharacterized protein LOC131009745 n=1 Tax=Salvia miltiorrhiza TaxID=226208 RepID=UPI0025AD7079|nr:uncharacterized protein LOC131009745 [Salvia miltiorrhiza]
MSGEWREVRRRGVGPSHPERYPVRQKYYPNHRYTPKTQSVGCRSSLGSVGEGFTVFFNNFPEGTWLETLERRFRNLGKVIDIFRPRKRDIKGKSFGFVRFDKDSDRESILKEMNNIWLGSYKLRAYIPRFERPPLKHSGGFTQSGGFETNIKEKKEAGGIRKIAFKVPLNKRTEGKTFAAALGGKSNNSSEPPADESVGFQPKEEELAWLKSSFTGYVKADFVWDEFEVEINSECAGLLKISTLGGNLVLIQSINQTLVKDILTELDEWSKFWFEWIRPWSYVDVCSQRTVWTKWFGVPLQAWNSRFFETVGARMGMVLKMHEKTSAKDRLDVAWIQMSTGLETLNRVFDCRIAGAHFKIRIEEAGDMQAEESPHDLEDLSELETENVHEEEAVDAFDSPVNAMIIDEQLALEKSASGSKTVQQPEVSLASTKGAASEVFSEKVSSKEVHSQSLGSHVPESVPSNPYNPSAPIENLNGIGEFLNVQGPKDQSLIFPNSPLPVGPLLGRVELGFGNQSAVKPIKPRQSNWDTSKQILKKKKGGEASLRLGIHRFLHPRNKKIIHKSQSCKGEQVLGTEETMSADRSREVWKGPRSK